MRDYERVAKDKDNKLEAPQKPDRYVMWDVTVEKLGQVLSQNKEHQGLLVKRDEIAGWIGTMEKYSGGGKGAAADRGFWLKAFDGGGYSVDRIGRGDNWIPNLSIGIIGGIQQNRLAELSEGLTSDGLLQRFIPLMQGAPTFPVDQSNEKQVGAYLQLVFKIIRRRVRRFYFNDGAQRIMDDLRKYLFDLEQASGGLAYGFQGFLGKLPGIAGSLALILHIVNIVEGDWDSIPAMAGSVASISERTAKYIDKLVRDFIVPHAFAFYQAAEGTSEQLRQIASFILTSSQTRITHRDLTRNVRSLRGKGGFKINELVSPLVAAGWLSPIDCTPTNSAWNVNPQVATQFEERRKMEVDRKKLVVELLTSPKDAAS